MLEDKIIIKQGRKSTNVRSSNILTDELSDMVGFVEQEQEETLVEETKNVIYKKPKDLVGKMERDGQTHFLYTVKDKHIVLKYDKVGTNIERNFRQVIQRKRFTQSAVLTAFNRAVATSRGQLSNRQNFNHFLFSLLFEPLLELPDEEKVVVLKFYGKLNKEENKRDYTIFIDDTFSLYKTSKCPEPFLVPDSFSDRFIHHATHDNVHNLSLDMLSKHTLFNNVYNGFGICWDSQKGQLNEIVKRNLTNKRQENLNLETYFIQSSNLFLQSVFNNDLSEHYSISRNRFSNLINSILQLDVDNYIQDFSLVERQVVLDYWDSLADKLVAFCSSMTNSIDCRNRQLLFLMSLYNIPLSEMKKVIG